MYVYIHNIYIYMYIYRERERCHMCIVYVQGTFRGPSSRGPFSSAPSVTPTYPLALQRATLLLARSLSAGGPREGGGQPPPRPAPRWQHVHRGAFARALCPRVLARPSLCVRAVFRACGDRSRASGPAKDTARDARLRGVAHRVLGGRARDVRSFC